MTMTTSVNTGMDAVHEPVRDLPTFRQTYNLPTQHDYMAMLTSPDHTVLAAAITAREQGAVIRMREEGFSGSTLAEAYEWWRTPQTRLTDTEGVIDGDACATPAAGGCACGGCCS